MEKNNGIEFDQSKENVDPDFNAQEEPEFVQPGPAEMDPEKRAVLLGHQIKTLSDEKKIKPLKEIGYVGGLDSLRYIMPLSQYSSEFLRKIARNSAIKIILRVLWEDEERQALGTRQKRMLLAFLARLEKKYLHLKDMELWDSNAASKLLDVLIQEDKEFTARTLAEIISDSDKKVRATAVKLISEMIEEKETILLIKMLNDPDPRVQANVIESLEAVGDRNVLGILMKYKRDKNERVRANTLKALWNLGFKNIESFLLEMLQDPNPRMRASAVWVIGEIGHKQINLKALIEIVEDDDDEMIQNNIERARKKIIWREKGLRILVVEDDKKFLQELFKKLARDGFHILAAFDGEMGVSIALKQTPDIIILNLRIQGMNGLEVLKELKAQEATREIPVVIICDFHSSVLIKKASEARANDYLIKPFAYEQVKEKIKLFT